jgi:hypothetical protein
MEIKVLNLYNTSIGLIGRLRFPDGIKPTMGRVLKKEEELYRIIGMTFNRDPDYIDENTFDCLLEFKENTLTIGDVLTYQITSPENV